jgi:hypothetical protein
MAALRLHATIATLDHELGVATPAPLAGGDLDGFGLGRELPLFTTKGVLPTSLIAYREQEAEW